MTYDVRVRGLVGGVSLAADAMGTPMRVEVADLEVTLRDGLRELTLELTEIDGVGVRGSECVVFIDGGDVIECVGEAAPALGAALARVLFAPPELLRAARAPLEADARRVSVWEHALAPLVETSAVLRRATDVRAAVRDATETVRGGVERLPLTLVGAPLDTPLYRARAARIADALTPVHHRLSELDTIAASVTQAAPDVLCRSWRVWTDVLLRVAASLRDQVPAIADAVSLELTEAPRRWFGARRGR
jgi:hypothetical protein